MFVQGRAYAAGSIKKTAIVKKSGYRMLQPKSMVKYSAWTQAGGVKARTKDTPLRKLSTDDAIIV